MKGLSGASAGWVGMIIGWAIVLLGLYALWKYDFQK